MGEAAVAVNFVKRACDELARGRAAAWHIAMWIQAETGRFIAGLGVAATTFSMGVFQGQRTSEIEKDPRADRYALRVSSLLTPVKTAVKEEDEWKVEDPQKIRREKETGVSMAKKYLLPLGTALATSRLLKAISHIDTSDVIGSVGLERRRSHFWERVAYLSLGALAGAGAALVLAPAPGKQTRERVKGQVDRLAGIANEKLRAVREHAPSLTSKNAETEGQYGSYHR